MRKLRQFLFRARALFQKDKLDAEMREEMQHHLELAAADRMADGAQADAARYAAQRKFGRMEQIKENCRDERSFAWWDETMRDVRFAARMLRKNPGFTLVVVLTLALGIGANTALFSVLNSVVLRPLPYADAGRLVWLAETWPGVEKASISYPNFIDWREQQRVFDRMGAYRARAYNLTGNAEPVQITVGEMSVDALSALGIQPKLGRLFTAEDDSPRGAAVALLSDSLWRARYGADPEILGQTILLEGRGYAVVGVMPSTFDLPRSANVWVPLGPVAAAANWTNRAAHAGIYSVAHLKPGVTLERARQDLDLIASGLGAQYPDANRGHRVFLTSLQAALVGAAGKTLWPLFGAAALVLLIACANVANLLLARASAREKEMALRAALGASRRQIVRQLLVESLMLAGLGGLVGLLLAKSALGGIVALMAGSLPTAADTRLNPTVLVFFAGAALLSAILFGLAPAWHTSRVVLQTALQNASRGSSGRGKLRHGLIVAELALTLVLLTGAGLLLRTMMRLQHVDPGFTTEHVLTFRVDLNTGKYPTPAQRHAFFESLVQRLRALPGVTSASLTSKVPLSGFPSNNEFVIDGRVEPPAGARPFVDVQVVERDFFQAMKIPLRRGRAFTGQEGANIIIDEEFARRYWPNQDPIGQGLRFTSGPPGSNPVLTVVGVVGRVKLESISEQGGNVQAYLPFTQGFRTNMTAVVRTTVDPASLVASAREQVLAIDPHQPINSVRTLDDLRELSGSPQRLNLVLLGTFALVALGLAAVGLYGVLSYLVAQRQREIGVRMALGARRGDVVKMILRQGLLLLWVGAAIGLPAAFALARVIGHLLFEVSTYDPLTFGAVVVVLAIVALFACWLPARRAAGVDPMIALRSE